jgi:hypothetical protein
VTTFLKVVLVYLFTSSLYLMPFVGWVISEVSGRRLQTHSITTSLRKEQKIKESKNIID